MVTLSLTFSPPSSFSSSPLKHKPSHSSSPLPHPKPSLHDLLTKNPHQTLPKPRNVKCRVDLPKDAPFALAIGACMLNSLVFPVTPSIEEEEEEDQEERDSVLDGTDARFAVMGIIGFIPYFNWLSWVFAWLDTGKRRYAVYALVYMAPYLRSNLSLSPEESWLPLASIIFCIVHIQLEASIRNGDIQGFQLFSDAARHLSSSSRKKDFHSQGHQGVREGREREQLDLPSGEEKSQRDVQQWDIPKNRLKDREHLNDDWHDDRRKE